MPSCCAWPSLAYAARAGGDATTTSCARRAAARRRGHARDARGRRAGLDARGRSVRSGSGCRSPTAIRSISDSRPCTGKSPGWSLDHVKPAGADAGAPAATTWSGNGIARPPRGCRRSKTTNGRISIVRARCFPPTRTSCSSAARSVKRMRRRAFRSACDPRSCRTASRSTRVGARWNCARPKRFFRRALEIKPDHVEARLRLGRVLGLLGQHADARESCVR